MILVCFRGPKLCGSSFSEEFEYICVSSAYHKIYIRLCLIVNLYTAME